MRYLLSSFCFFLFVSCASYPKKIGLVKEQEKTVQVYNPYFSNKAKDYVYKANLQFYKRKFSGIVIIKKIADHEHRLVFTTEMGNKIMDLSFSKKGFKVNSMIEALNKKIIINTLKKDFTALVKEYNTSLSTYRKEDYNVKEVAIEGNKYFYFYDQKVLRKMVRTAKRKEKVAYQFSEINKNSVQEVLIAHKNIQLKIQLKKI